MSFGLLSRAPCQVSVTVSTFDPSGFIREIRRPVCSQKTIAPLGVEGLAVGGAGVLAEEAQSPVGADFIRFLGLDVLEQERAVGAARAAPR